MMIAIRDALTQYVMARRALGTKFKEPAATLGQFVDFLDHEGAQFITTDLALRWACQSKNVQRATWSRRLTMVRRFASWLSAFDPRTQVPPKRILYARHRRNKPFIFTDNQIELLMAQAARLQAYLCNTKDHPMVPGWIRRTARAAKACHLSGPCQRQQYLLVYRSRSGAITANHPIHERAGRCKMSTSSFPSLLQRFFTDRLLGQLGASQHTVAGYRDAFRLLLRFASQQLGRAPSQLRMEDLDASFLGKFIDSLEAERGNSTRTRNNCLSALQSFFRYVAFTEPALALHCQRVLAIPAKRYQRAPVEFLTEEETSALVAAPDTRTWIGRRDHSILLVAVHTGLRNSEITSLRCQDVEFGIGAHVRCLGKGRKMRCTPLLPEVTYALKNWLSERRGKPNDPVFPNSRGTRLSADALQRLICRHVATACKSHPSLVGRKITPHTLRHSAAMALLHRGVDLSVIALWLGHESTETTQIYLHADMRLKEQALAHATASGLTPERFIPSDSLLTFLESL